MSMVEEINDIRDLAQFRPLWNALLAETRDASFFQSLEWLEVYWKHFAGNQKLRVIVVGDSGETAGIVPLVVRPVRTRVGELQYLTYPLDDWGSFYGPVGPRPWVTLQAAFRHIQRARRDWDVFELRWVDADGRDGGLTGKAFEASGIPAHKHPWVVASLVELNGTYDEYLASRSAGWRRSHRRNERTLSRKGAVTHVRYRPRGEDYGETDPRWDLYEACEEIARRSWQGASRTGTTLSHESIRGFLREMHETASRLGAVDVNLLMVNGEPVAFNYGYHCRGYVDVIRCGFDPNLDGAGSLALERLIRESYDLGDRKIDLGPGSLEYKRRWHTDSVTSYRYTHFARTDVQAQLLNFNRWAKQQLHRFSSVWKRDEALVNASPGADS